MEGERSGEIKGMVKRYYGSVWSSEASCCQPPQSEEDEESCQSCGSPPQEDILQSPKKRLMEVLSPKPSMKILDVGSGPGETVLTIAERVAPNGLAAGVDLSEEAIKLSKERAEERGLSKLTEFRLGDAERLPFDDETFDAVVSECVVCLVPDKQKALDEKVRVLKPGGRVIMHDVVSWLNMPEAVKNDPTLYCECIGGAVTVDDYRNMMMKAGLEDIRVIDYTNEVKPRLGSLIASAAARIEDDDQFMQVVSFIRKGGIGYALFIGTKSTGSKQGPGSGKENYQEDCGCRS